jgi:quercetin dioxygenase-like cupin family protein
VNAEVDVLVLVMAGDGALTIDADTHQLSTGACALVPSGSARAIAAGAHGLAYLTVHRARPGLGISPKR